MGPAWCSRRTVTVPSMAETGGQPQRLALTAGHRYIRPHWSLDGQRIFATRIEGGAGKLSYVAIVFDIAAGKEMPLASLGAAVAGCTRME